jgi:hypothetical protein
LESIEDPRGARGGARADQPKCVRILAITGIFDGGDDRRGHHHTGAVFQVDIEHPA